MKPVYSTTIANLRGWLHWKRIEIETTIAQQPSLTDAMACETAFVDDIEALLTEHDRLKTALRMIAYNEAPTEGTGQLSKNIAIEALEGK